MKQILSLIIGLLIIIFSNTVINFISFEPRVDLILIYIILLSIYSNQNKYSLYLIGIILGFVFDCSVGRFSCLYTILFLSIMLVGVFLRDKLVRDSFSVIFFISLFFVAMSSVYISLFSINNFGDFISIYSINAIYIFKTMMVISVFILILNKIIKKMER